jgi:hypothetical protein
MRTIGRLAGLFVILVGFTGCLGKPKSQNCSVDTDCENGAMCYHGSCTWACKDIGCRDGGNCDPESGQCKDYCPYTCPPPPANATALCGEACEYACIAGVSHQCGEECALDDDAARCGEGCVPCQAPDSNGIATCGNNECGYACDQGFHGCSDEVKCYADSDAQKCGETCQACPVPSDPGAQATCINGQCTQACRQGYTLCGGACCLCLNSGCTMLLNLPGIDDEPIVVDLNTNTLWQRCARGQTGTSCDGTATRSMWLMVANNCATSDWGSPGTFGASAPTVDDLATIVDLTKGPPVIDSDVFPNTPSGPFWSQELNPDAEGQAYYVDFGTGLKGSGSVSASAYVRCHRHL